MVTINITITHTTYSLYSEYLIWTRLYNNCLFNFYNLQIIIRYLF